MAMIGKRRNWVVALWSMAAVILWSGMAVAEDEAALRVVVVDGQQEGTQAVADTLRDMGGMDIRSVDWFEDQVSSRAFNVDTILDNPSDLGWVMSGSSIDLIVDIREDSDEDFEVRLITAEEAEVEHRFLADRGSDGGMRRGGAAIIQLELERFLDRRPDVVAGALQEAEEDAERQAEERQDEDEADGGEAPVAADPQALREQAAADADELREILSRDWLWIKGYGRLLNKNFSVAAADAVYVYNSGMFAGYELDIEAFPFGQTDPDLEQAGVYANFVHGRYSLNIVEDTEDGEEAASLSVNDLTLEGGAMYRLDSPVEATNRQLRFKLGGRYERFSVSENPLIPTTSMVSVVLGTRLVLPVQIDQLAVTAGLDIMPLGFFGAGSELFGADSFSFGFGSELGVLFEVFDNGFISAGYHFRMMRTEFEAEGEAVNEEGGEPLVFVDSDAFDLKHGLRAGFVFQY